MSLANIMLGVITVISNSSLSTAPIDDGSLVHSQKELASVIEQCKNNPSKQFETETTLWGCNQWINMIEEEVLDRGGEIAPKTNYSNVLIDMESLSKVEQVTRICYDNPNIMFPTQKGELTCSQYLSHLKTMED